MTRSVAASAPPSSDAVLASGQSAPAPGEARTSGEAQVAPPPDDDPAGEVLRSLLHEELGRRIDALHRFVDRRFDELSVEVHGAVQMVDFSETNLSGQIAAVHAQVAGMVAAPAQATRNSGVELEAVVEATENAAGRIMDAAEAISRLIDGRTDADREVLESNVNAIFEACSFQDLTGQRIRRAISHLQSIETLLQQMMADPANAPLLPEPPPTTTTSDTTADLGQDDIDRLLG